MNSDDKSWDKERLFGRKATEVISILLYAKKRVYQKSYHAIFLKNEHRDTETPSFL